jgi:1-acyl-sn-glycerol-3-phosphate acyltransferase
MPAVPLKITPESLALMSKDDQKAALREVALEQYVRPRPNAFFMTVTRILIDHLGFPGLPFFARFQFLRRLIPWIAGLRIVKVEVPEKDDARMRAALDPENACFVAVNHPDFFTDVVVDWHLMSRIAKKIAFWAGYGIVNMPVLRTLWLNHNLIATTAGGDGKRYSIESARRGTGVLLHPEGNVFFTNDHIQPIFPGVATMALDTAATIADDGESQRTLILPMVWKYRFTADATDGLVREMRFVERRLGLPSGESLGVGDRFFALMREVLRREEARAGLVSPPLDDAHYFERSEALLTHLIERSEHEVGIADRVPTPGESLRDRLRHIERAARFLKTKEPKRYATISARLAVMHRLEQFSPRFYNSPTLTQEQMAECMKRLRFDAISGKLTDMLRRWIPFPVADRIVHVRTGEPVDVTAFVASHPRNAARVESVRALVENRMRETLNALLDEVSPLTAAHAIDNAFARR